MEPSAAGVAQLRGASRARAAIIAALTFSVLVSVLVAWVGCSESPGPEERLCGRLVRFHLGLHHPVEIVDAQRTSEKPRVRIAYRGTRQESSSIKGVALCRFSDQTGELQVLGAYIDGDRLGTGAIRAFNKFVASRRRAGG